MSVNLPPPSELNKPSFSEELKDFTKGYGLIIEDGTLKSASWITVVWEKIKGYLGKEDKTAHVSDEVLSYINKHQVEMQGVSLQSDEAKLIIKLAQQAGIIPRPIISILNKEKDINLTASRVFFLALVKAYQEQKSDPHAQITANKIQVARTPIPARAAPSIPGSDVPLAVFKSTIEPKEEEQQKDTPLEEDVPIPPQPPVQLENTILSTISKEKTEEQETDASVGEHNQAEPQKEASQDSEKSLPARNESPILDAEEQSKIVVKPKTGNLDKINLPPKGIPTDKNINACYRNASNQAIFNFKPLRQLIEKPLERRLNEKENDFEVREEIRQALNNLCESLDSGQNSELVQFAEVNLRTLLFFSNLEHDEFVQKNVTRQLDAATYIDLILSEILGYQGLMSITKSAGTDKFTTFDVANPCIRIDFIDEKELDLQKLLNNTFSSKIENHHWKHEGKTHPSYTNTMKLSGEPQEVLVLQLERFKPPDEWKKKDSPLNDEIIKQHYGRAGERVPDVELAQMREWYKGEMRTKGSDKIEDPVKISDDCKIDLSEAYGKEEKLNYQIKSFICHWGPDGTTGHYVSYVNKEDKWYCCNDGEVKSVDTQLAMKEMSQAYIFMLEKI